MTESTKAYYDKRDIMQRYGVGESKARILMRCIKNACGGGKLGKGKVLPCELEHWENQIITYKET